MIRQLLFFILLHLLVGNCLAQTAPDSSIAMSSQLGQQYVSAISNKAEKMSGQLEKQTAKYLSKLEKQEARLQKKLAKIDSLAASKIFVDAKQQYQQLQNRVKDKSAQLRNQTAKYLPWLDSSATSLQFLQKNAVLSGLKEDANKLNGAVAKVSELQQQLKQAASVKEFLRERKEYLKQQLQQYNLGNELKKYNQTAYYYSQQINDYRQALTDHEKAERKVLSLLNSVPAFHDFFSKHSILASMFAPPGTTDPSAVTQNLQGLQTTASVQGLIQNQLAAGGPNAQAMFQQNIEEAQGMLNTLKAKLNQLKSNGGDDLDLPDFTPNTQKTKSFLQRLEYGTNIQSVKSNYFFPTTTDIALSVGYKLNEKSMVGIGASYKMGWGKDISHIAISSEGMGLRSFVDMKLKGSFYASGGLEYNYQQPFGTIEQLKKLNTWQQSGLLGISKIISLKTKYFQKTKLQLLWDVLSYQQRPRTQAVKFRVGYSF